MTYQILARKWRPQDFKGLVGQAPIVTALRNAVTEGRVAQAYLFAGIRGVGKTTTARLLAKALNCEQSSDGNPCNDCQTCHQITDGADLDVIEIDAATHSKVEQVRELTDSLRYGPARDRYKVVVVDEIHRLSRNAFDALLKIVEEPPSHLVFIFATTEIDAVPATIISRCQEFYFRRVPAPELVEYLSTICEAEGITASDAALHSIVRAGEGSVRDAVSLLDQLATFGNSKIDDQDAHRLLGGLDLGLLHEILTAILDGQTDQLRSHLRTIETNGWDPQNVYGQFLSYLRQGLHFALGADANDSELPNEAAAALATLVADHPYESILRLNHLMLDSEVIVRRSEYGLIALEIAMLRAAEQPKLRRIEDLIAGHVDLASSESSSQSSPPSKPSRRPPSAKPAPPVRPPATARRKEPESRQTPEQPTAQAPPPRAALSTRDSQASARQVPPATADEQQPSSPRKAHQDADPIEDFLVRLSMKRQSLAAHLRSAKLTYRDGQLSISPRHGDLLLRGALQRGKNVEVLQQVMTEIWPQTKNRWTLEADQAKPEEEETEPTLVPADEELSDHPTVQAVLDIFGGKVESASPKSESH